MGELVKGQWQDTWYDTNSTGGKFVRPKKEEFRRKIGDKGFAPESGRYHLYVSLACPWAHRTLLMRELKDLTPHISVSVVSPFMLENGWTFAEYPCATGDDLYQKEFLYQIYQMAKPDYSGRVTVPVLWDKHEKTIVNNESSDIVRIFNSAFDEITGNRLDFYPESLRSAIDEINAYVYPNINDGVYRTGFATTQSAYEESFQCLFEALDSIEEILQKQTFLCGDYLTEADIRLFTTLVRFDAVYFGHFKCNKKQIKDYPELWDYTRCLYQIPGVGESCNFDHIKAHYYYSHKHINPTQIIPLGPELDFNSKTKRGPVELTTQVMIRA